MSGPNVAFSQDATDDLAAIVEYIALQDGLSRSKQVAARIFRALDAVAYSPGIGRVRIDLEGAPRQFSVPPWIILYEPELQLAGIYVLHIYDGRRDLDRILKDYRRPVRKAP